MAAYSLPSHFPVIAPQYGIAYGRAAHSTWLQTGAELGFPGLACLLFGIYGTCIVRLWPLTKENSEVADPWLRYLARMVISGLVGFIVAAQFLSAEAVEVPYYLALIGAGTLRMASQLKANPAGTSQIRTAPAPIARTRYFGIIPRTIA